MTINCNSCSKEIETKKDLVVIFLLGFIPRKYHRTCYADIEKGFWRHIFYFPPKWPINSLINNLTIIFGILIWLLVLVAFLFIPDSNWKPEPPSTTMKIVIILIISIAVLWALILRLYSLQAIEKKLL